MNSGVKTQLRDICQSLAFSSLITANPNRQKRCQQAEGKNIVRRLLFTHLLLPLALLLFSIGGSVFLDLDRRLADLIFALQGGAWTLQHHWLTETVLHSGGRMLAGVMIVGLFSALIASFLRPGWHPYRRALTYLTVTILISFALINGLKAISGVPCPWSVARYGGSTAFHDWFAGFSGGHGCFPAGHASGGYVWVALYFFALIHYYDRRYHALAIGIILGLAFGIAQQFRGAHFLSHDLVTLGICWLTSLSAFLLWFRNDFPTLSHITRVEEK